MQDFENLSNFDSNRSLLLNRRSRDFYRRKLERQRRGSLGQAIADAKTSERTSRCFAPQRALEYLQRSTAGSLNVQFGSNGDVPTPAAFGQ
jgi:hypothetical protein